MKINDTMETKFIVNLFLMMIYLLKHYFCLFKTILLTTLFSFINSKINLRMMVITWNDE